MYERIPAAERPDALSCMGSNQTDQYLPLNRRIENGSNRDHKSADDRSG